MTVTNLWWQTSFLQQQVFPVSQLPLRQGHLKVVQYVQCLPTPVSSLEVPVTICNVTKIIFPFICPLNAILLKKLSTIKNLQETFGDNHKCRVIYVIVNTLCTLQLQALTQCYCCNGSVRQSSSVHKTCFLLNQERN